MYIPQEKQITMIFAKHDPQKLILMGHQRSEYRKEAPLALMLVNSAKNIEEFTKQLEDLFRTSFKQAYINVDFADVAVEIWNTFRN